MEIEANIKKLKDIHSALNDFLDASDNYDVELDTRNFKKQRRC